MRGRACGGRTPTLRRGIQIVPITYSAITDLALKERALARTAPINATPGRYQPSDKIIAFLDSL